MMVNERQADRPQMSGALAELPPSAKMLYLALYYEGDMKQAEVAEMCGVAQRTIRYAAKRLSEETDLLDIRPVDSDNRFTLYALTDPNAPSARPATGD